MDEIKKGISIPVPCTVPRFVANAAVPGLQETEIHMARFLHRLKCPNVCNVNRWLLAIFWITGILSGILISYGAGSSVSSLMHSYLYGSVSIVGLVLVLYLPFLLSAIAVSFSGRVLLFPIVFLKGFLFSFVAMGIFQVYGCAGWLIHWFLCFSDLILLPLLYWYWIRLLDTVPSAAFRDGVLLLAPVYCIGSLDYCLVFPYFADMINL